MSNPIEGQRQEPTPPRPIIDELTFDVKAAHTLMLAREATLGYSAPHARAIITGIHSILDSYERDMARLKRSNPRYAAGIGSFCDKFTSAMRVPLDYSEARKQLKKLFPEETSDGLVKLDKTWAKRGNFTSEAIVLGTVMLEDDPEKLAAIDRFVASRYPRGGLDRMESADLYTLLFRHLAMGEPLEVNKWNRD